MKCWRNRYRHRWVDSTFMPDFANFGSHSNGWVQGIKKKQLFCKLSPLILLLAVAYIERKINCEEMKMKLLVLLHIESL